MFMLGVSSYYSNRNKKLVKRIIQILVILECLACSYQINLEINKSISDQVNSSDLTRLKRDLSSNDQTESFQNENRRISRGKQKNRRKRGDNLFSEWGNWGSCDIYCRHKRERYCLKPRKCGGVKQMEERPCPQNLCEQMKFPQFRQPKYQAPPLYQDNRLPEQKKKKNPVFLEMDSTDNPDEFDGYQKINLLKNGKNTSRIQNKLVLKVVKQGNSRNNDKLLRRSDSNSYNQNQEFFLPRNITDYDTPSVVKDFPGKPQSLYGDDLVADDDDSLELQEKSGRTKAVFELPRKPISQYTKWSRWSKCSPKCVTRRYKKCREHARHICGNDIIREVAYCYTEGSFCQEWITSQYHQVARNQIEIHTKPPKTKRPKVDRKTESPLSNSVSQNFYYNSNKHKANWQPEYKPQNFQCGFPSIRNKGSSFQLKILGGKISRRGQWPWQVVILNRFKEPFCGGTLISPTFILTASHCVRKKLYVRLGEYNLSKHDGSEVELKIERSIKHPKYNRTTVDNDIALLKLPISIERSHYIGFACLPERYQSLPVGHTCTILGWGKRKHNDDAGTDLLHEAEVPIISNEECKNVYYDYTITKNMFCAGHKKGRIDTCAGDSGGPILCRDSKKPNKPWTVYGVTSFGDGCGKKNKFGIYAKLPNYVDWIWSTINCNGVCKNN